MTEQFDTRTDDGRLKYRGCKPNEHGESIPIPDGEAEEPPATDEAAFEEWWKGINYEPYTDRTWAMIGWQKRGLLAEVTERELQAEIEKLKAQLAGYRQEHDAGSGRGRSSSITS